MWDPGFDSDRLGWCFGVRSFRCCLRGRESCAGGGFR